MQNEPLGTVLENICSQNIGKVLVNFFKDFDYNKTKKGKNARFS